MSGPVDAAPNGPRRKGSFKESEAPSIARETCATDAPPYGETGLWRGPIREVKDSEGREYCESAIASLVIFLLTLSSHYGQ